jgi:hypothetical protein
MPSTTTRINWLSVFFGIVLLAAFFLPWLNWTGTSVSGADMPTGKFFDLSEEKFDLANPFPEYSAANIIFWLIPGLAALIVVLQLARKKTGLIAALAGIIALSLVTMYILFTQTIIDNVGLVKSLTAGLKIGIYATIIGAAGIIIASIPNRALLKIALVLIGPLVTWSGYQFLSSQALKDHDDTRDVKSAYTVNSLELIREFEANDSLANAKYKEKILTVNGKASAVEIVNDSTVNIKFADTTGSYAIFSFGPPDAEKAKTIREGDDISVKGSCSGGEYSDILEVHFITFKRSVLNK